MQCVVCKSILSKRAPGLPCDSCDKNYHSKCVKLTKEKYAEIIDKELEWKCVDCRTAKTANKKRQSVLSSFNEQGQSSSSDSEGENVVDNINASYAAVVGELKNISKTQKTFEKSLITFSSLIDDFNKKVKYFESKMKQVDRIAEENVELKRNVITLSNRLNEFEQGARMNDVEIAGIPEKNGENLLVIVQSIGVAVKCPFNEKDVDVVHRVQCFDKSKTKNIIVRFQSRQLKNKLVASSRIYVRENGVLKLNNINYDSNSLFYVNEHLMPERKLLFLKAKKFCSENNIKYIWVKDCKILARKTEHTRIKLINSFNDLQHL